MNNVALLGHKAEDPSLIKRGEGNPCSCKIPDQIKDPDMILDALNENTTAHLHIIKHLVRMNEKIELSCTVALKLHLQRVV